VAFLVDILRFRPPDFPAPAPAPCRCYRGSGAGSVSSLRMRLVRGNRQQIIGVFVAVFVSAGLVGGGGGGRQ